MNKLVDDIKQIIFTEQMIAARIEEMGCELTARYTDKNPLMLCTLKGAAVFYADLCRKMDCPLEMEFMRVSSYGDGTTSGDLVIKKDIEVPVIGRHVIICDDIMDTGRTLFCLRKLLTERGAKSVEIVCMFDKPAHRSCDITPDLSGFSVPDGFLVGYGLDYAQKYRNLPFVGIIKGELI